MALNKIKGAQMRCKRVVSRLQPNVMAEAAARSQVRLLVDQLMTNSQLDDTKSVGFRPELCLAFG